ncbi:TPA: hypothetical protein DD449_04195 [Candidatus Berkelbacteria bacterium]|uniref:Uncharacterized protein n=1 Tax=Berkelbacteria bacterium GW2011_GWE1_39_12 TaxID=1618337 RepID=A0A0G4B3Y9_9BACT|nr:MAG: hypothetical protein UT28_C0001G0460 [Berkelbacteria bacterium GW2011_GWE1_39_12]HBO60856.1 hypothetical protein [Candidatus Berkelbacteria bacterium]
MEMIKLNDQYAVVWFPRESFYTLKCVVVRLTAEGLGLEQLTAVPDLNILRSYSDDIWQKYQKGEAPASIFATTMQGKKRPYCTPFVNVHPQRRRVNTNWLTMRFNDCCGFLVRL